MKKSRAARSGTLALNGATALAILSCCLLCAGPARAQDGGDADHAVILELGGAGEWPTHGGAANFGGTIAAEYTPIENWLELEFGLTALGSTGRTELSGDFLFKKPWRLSRTVEFMVGAGPSLARALNGPDRGTTLSAEFVLDFMFWPRRNIGWYLEPGWSVAPKTWERTIGVNAGLIFGLP